MISIGDFAALGRVSVRMLRHYDSLGLLPPASVDPATGYRSYEPAQVRLLNRIVALKELGLRLEQVHSIIGGDVSGDELRAMLRLRQAELESQIAEGTHRLARVEARLRLIDQEDRMSQQQVSVKTVQGMCGLGLSGVAASATHEDVGPVVGPMFERIVTALCAAGVVPAGPSVAHYVPAPDVSDDALRVFAAFPVALDAVDGLQRVEVPGGTVASLIHHGSVDGVDETYQLLRSWAVEHTRPATGAAREVYLESPEGDMDAWVTEIQLDLRR